MGNAVEPSEAVNLFHALINVTGQIISLAVLHCQGNCQAVHIEDVTVRLGVVEQRAEFFFSVVSAR
ncbi:MAG TPA: hypothetical protein DCY53_03030 [Desulfobacteraceae bacterium]|nr:hypothetical protein [Desulfobacteraceae bacterium]